VDIVCGELSEQSIMQCNRIKRIGGDYHVGADLSGMSEHASKIGKGVGV